MYIIPEKRYLELIMAKKEDYYSRVLVALSDVKEGKVKTFNTSDDLLKDLEVDKTELSREIISDSAWEIGFDERIVVVPVVLSRDKWEHGPEQASLLANAVREEGVSI